MTQDRGSERREEFLRMRVFIPAAVSMFALLLLAVMLYFEQIRSGDARQKQISRQSIRQIRIPARRGMIYTGDLCPLTENRPAFELLFYPEEMKQKKLSSSVKYILKCADEISAHAGLRHDLTFKAVQKHLNMRPGLPLHVLGDLGDENAAKIMEAARNIPGAEVQPMETRTYPEHRLACHLVGYTRPGDPRQAPDRKDYTYYLPDEIGVSGVEKLCDGKNPFNGQPGLRGIPGYSLIQVDRLGFVRKKLIERIDPVNGTHVVLTIDSTFQGTAENLLRGRNGAVVAVDADNGDILAAASSPGYDASVFSPKISREKFAGLRDDPNRPLFNRALQGVYPPGSTLKPLIALAYLKAGIDPAKKIECSGSSEVYGIRIRCASHRRGGHGELDMHDALKYSCNVYMIEYAKETGLELLQEMLRAAGFGRKCGTGLAESAGLFPSDRLKRRRRNQVPWNIYDTALLSIGQGLIGVTPLQAAIYCAALANGGTVWRPNLIARTVDTSGQDLWLRTPVVSSRLPVSQDQLKLIADAMLDVVASPDGSGRNAAVPGLEIRGKTGSAEYGKGGMLRIYAWFIAYAKIGGRTVAVAIVVEDGESGGRTCAPLAAEFFSSIQER